MRTGSNPSLTQLLYPFSRLPTLFLTATKLAERLSQKQTQECPKITTKNGLRLSVSFPSRFVLPSSSLEPKGMLAKRNIELQTPKYRTASQSTTQGIFWELWNEVHTYFFLKMKLDDGEVTDIWKDQYQFRYGEQLRNIWQTFNFDLVRRYCWVTN